VSRHHARAHWREKDVLVVAGYDRPLRQVFLQVLITHDGDNAADENVLYASVHEPWRDWSDVATVRDQLAQLGMVVPNSLLNAVRLDQISNAGNRVVEHHADRPPAVLAG
jgi:hypothetical protein